MGAVADEVVYVSRIYLLLGCWWRVALGWVRPWLGSLELKRVGGESGMGLRRLLRLQGCAVERVCL